jgi:hypothetical protein
MTNLTDRTLELNATQPAGSKKAFWIFTAHKNIPIMTKIETLLTS